MSTSLHRLFAIANQPVKTIVGLMSGTSLDGLDIAVCTFTGSGMHTQIQLVQHTTIPYNQHFTHTVQQIFANRQADLQQVCLLNKWIAEQHAQMVLNALAQWQIAPSSIDCLASHGQTIYHAPLTLHQQAMYGNATLQIGDGDHLAVATGIITLSDFRQKHLAGGGEGAPLALYGDYLLFSHETEDRVLLNIGGIANLTFLPSGKALQGIVCTDVGPGNTLLDAYVRTHFAPLTFDADAAIAATGTVNHPLLQLLLQHPFFQQPFPKTTGPELFHLTYLEHTLQQLPFTVSHADVLATLCMFTATGIAQAVTNLPTENVCIYISGGGMHNPLLMQYLRSLLPNSRIQSTQQLGIAPDAKEAVLFAVLANETFSGSKVPFGLAHLPQLSMGKISLPD